jgi:hypothetical protein
MDCTVVRLSRRSGSITTPWSCLVSKIVACWISLARSPSSASISLPCNDVFVSLLEDSNSFSDDESSSSSSSLRLVDSSFRLVSPPL